MATALIAAPELFPHPADAFSQIGAVAGHSVGEIAAAAGAQAITAEQAMVLVRERGNAMAAAAATTPTGMTAGLGGDRDEVLAALDAQGLTPANDNGPGQIVAAGTLEQLQARADNPPAKARLIPLSVAGAFHTVHMAPPSAVRRRCRSVFMYDPRTPLISNRDGQILHYGREVVARIVGEIARPVRWDLCMETMSDLGATGLLGCPPPAPSPGSPRPCPVETFALKTPDQLDDARDFCAKHGEASMIDTTPTWLMVVSPMKGPSTAPRRPRRPQAGSGATVGDVASRERTAVRPRTAARWSSWLVEDGDLVSPGQPLVRLHPEGAA